MNYLGAIAIVLIFVVVLKKLRLIENSRIVFSISGMALECIRNAELSDDEKETRVQQYALQLFKQFFIVTASVIISIAVPLGLIWVLDYLSVMSFKEVINISLSPWFLVASTFILIVFFWVTTKKS